VEEVREQMDFVLAFAVVHEAPDSLQFLKEVAVLKAGGTALCRTKGHVSEAEFSAIVQDAVKAGLRIAEVAEGLAGSRGADGERGGAEPSREGE